MRTKNAAAPAQFRTYRVRDNQESDCFIWEAARATTAAPTIFRSMRIFGPGGIPEEFTDGGLKWNNPVRVVIEEGSRVFGDERRVACVVSIGTGHPSAIGLRDADWYQALLPKNVIDLLKDLATDCEDKASDCEKQYDRLPGLYYRFNVQHGLENVSLEKYKMLSEVTTHTKTYLQEPLVERKLNQLVDVLRTRSANATAAQLRMILTSS